MAGKKKIKNYNKSNIELTNRDKRLKYLKAKRNIRQAQVHISRVRIFARISATVLLFFAIYKFSLLPGWFLSPATFLFHPNYSLILEGNNITSNAQILSSLRQVELPIKPIYLLETKGLEKALIGLEPIKKVYIRRFAFPARLKIVINEKVPIISISPSQYVNPIAVFASDSSIIGSEYLPLKEDLTYHILTYDDFTQWTPKHVEFLAKLCKTIEVYSEQNIKYLDIRNPDDVVVQLDGLKLKIGALNDSISKRVKKVSSVIGKANEIKDTVNYVDLRWDQATYIKTR